jgi:hypothetical protein
MFWVFCGLLRADTLEFKYPDMEYTFRNSPGEMPSTIQLSEHGITVKQGNDQYSVPYIGINQVNLDKVGNKVFRAVVLIEGHRPLVITNKYHADQVTVEDRSRAYSTFIRVLHYHLKDKSRALYASGSDASRLWGQICAAATVAFLVSFTAEFAGFSLLEPVFQGSILAAALGVAIMARYAGHWPRRYKPTEIPMRLLP